MDKVDSQLVGGKAEIYRRVSQWKTWKKPYFVSFRASLNKSLENRLQGKNLDLLMEKDYMV